MKLVFICTSLAPGRDGVGDYVRQLASACAADGHVCILVAVHDRHLPATTPLQHRGNEIRFSATLSWNRRAELLGNLVGDFDPHWVSWQVVPYGFHQKGILPAASFALVDAVRRWPNQVMLHELWLGLARTDPIKPRIVGAFQRRRVLAFLRRLRPSVVHTTNEAYQLALARCGWLAEILPLFGNMPVLPLNPTAAQSALNELAGALLPSGPHCLGVIFGTIHPQWDPTATIEWLKNAAGHLQKEVCLLAVGRAGPHGEKMLAQIAHDQSGIRVISIGPQAPETISLLLQTADFGIATHPWVLLEKSGTTVSLLEHGVPVLVPRDDWHLREGSISATRDPLLTKLTDLPPAEFPRWLSQRRAPASQLPTVAATFLNQLSSSTIQGALVA